MRSIFYVEATGMKRYYQRRKRSIKVLIRILLTVTVLLVLFVRVDIRLRPLIQEYGIQAVRRGVVLAIHNGVEAVLSERGTKYGDLVKVDRSADGRILAAHADMAAVNLLKSAVTSAVNENMNRYQNQTVSIPMGSLVGGSFFIGRGPFLKVNISSRTSVITTLSDAFTDAGINQTCHRIHLNLKAYVSAILPLERCSFELETTFLICETILVGEVPETFANLSLF